MKSKKEILALKQRRRELLEDLKSVKHHATYSLIQFEVSSIEKRIKEHQNKEYATMETI